MLNQTISRRDFLKAGGSLVVTFSLSGLVPGAGAQSAATGKTVAIDAVDGFVAIGADGSVSIYSGKVDLGTGVRTALTQIAADELDVPFGKVKVTEGDTALTPDQGPTYGSLSIQIGGMQIRQACATARAALVAEAAKRLSVAPGDVTTQDGMCVAKGQRVGYHELIGNKNFQLKVDPKATLKDPATYKVVGKSVPRLDIPAKVTGEF